MSSIARTDTLLQRIVAVKVISATIDGNPDLRERFFREARAAGQLSHRNIITIHDLGEHEGVPYLAMEYFEGEDLQRRMAGHDRMSISHKLDLAIEVCEGLEFAHTHAVIHRDIKPANIFITDNGTVKLLDFGLARLVTSELTHSNMMMGTLNYMAPEQVRGERADHRSDIFATGVVLYELLSGRKAFQGDSFAATLYKILQEVPEPLDRIDSTLPWQMVAIVERALAKPRDERYQQMSEMLRDLLTVRQQQVFSESPTGYRSVTSAYPSPLPQPAPGSGGQRPGSGPQRPGSGVGTAPTVGWAAPAFGWSAAHLGRNPSARRLRRHRPVQPAAAPDGHARAHASTRTRGTNFATPSCDRGGGDRCRDGPCRRRSNHLLAAVATNANGASPGASPLDGDGRGPGYPGGGEAVAQRISVG